MSRRLWRCRNRACPVPHGAVLGHVTENGALALDRTVIVLQCYLDSRRAMVTCPACGQVREFRGSAIIIRQETTVPP